jgi:leucyl aminopeptidase
LNVEVVAGELKEVEADAVLVGIREGEKLSGDLAEIDQLLGGAISEAAEFAGKGELSGKRGEIAVFYTRGALKARRVVVAGLGKKADASPRLIREVTGAAVRHLRDRNHKRVASLLHRASTKQDSELAAATVEGAIMGMWEPDCYRAESDRKQDLDSFLVVEPDPKRVKAVEQGAQIGRILGESANFARDLVNEPANELTPAMMANRTREMASAIGLGCEVLDEDDMYRHGMGGILAVSVGSENRSRLIVLKHMPNPGEPALALVGKGITFDTGGISIKPTEGMGAMKGDMAGAAAIIGAMRAIHLIDLPVNVVGVAPCAENMPSGKAFRPGDVVRFMNGKTAEIITTDAEGRLVLADALTYAVRNLHAMRAVDVATLTGACVVALGHVTTGAFTNNRELMDALRSAADSAGERVWELPLFDEYKKQIKSDIADMKNSGGRPGGAISGAMFVKEFVDDVPWVHLDIAGTAKAEHCSHLANGPSGVMVRTLVRLAESVRS